MKISILNENILVKESEEPRKFVLQRKEGGTMCATTLLEIDNRIIIFGDVSPGKGGVISDLGYTLDWFARQEPSHYLASKFLEWGTYDEERARDKIMEVIKETIIPDFCEGMTGEGDLLEEVNAFIEDEGYWNLDEGPERFIANARDYKLDDAHTIADFFDEYSIGVGYDLRHEATLFHIQEVFADRYLKVSGKNKEF